MYAKIKKRSSFFVAQPPKLTSLLLIALLGFAFAACGGSSPSDSPDSVTPVADDFTITGCEQVYSGDSKEVTITPNQGKSTGDITVWYESPEYTKSEEGPGDIGTYTVTFDVAAAGGFTAATNLPGGELKIVPPGTPIAADFDFSGLGEQELGDLKEVTVTPKPGKSPGEVTVFYEGIDPTNYGRSETLPDAVGNYAVTFDVPAAAGWESATGLSAGTLSVIPTSRVTMVTAKEGTVTIDLTGTGDATIYWGDGTEPNTRTLSGHPNYSSFAHTYAAASGEKTIRIVSGGTLETMDCANEQLTSLDVTKNTELEYLWCFGNQLTNLDLGKNTALLLLHCQNNPLETLDLRANAALAFVDCGSNQLTSLSFSNDTGLKELLCSGQFTSLDLNNSPELTRLSCSNNRFLSSLDVSGAPELTDLTCNGNGLTELDLGGSLKLKRLECSNNLLTSLDLSKHTALTYLSCSENDLVSLDVSGAAALSYLSCGNNELTSLNLTNNTALTDLACSSNGITSLNVSGALDLTRLWCGSNQLTALDVSENLELTDLRCYENPLGSLDVTANLKLTALSCYDNELASLDVANNIALTELACLDNRLTELDVGNNTALTYLNCRGNGLTSLDVTAAVVLTDLFCANNQLDQDALNALFGTLHSNPGTKRIFCGGTNPGYTASDKEIAIAKGWTVGNL